MPRLSPGNLPAHERHEAAWNRVDDRRPLRRADDDLELLAAQASDRDDEATRGWSCSYSAGGTRGAAAATAIAPNGA